MSKQGAVMNTYYNLLVFLLVTAFVTVIPGFQAGQNLAEANPFGFGEKAGTDIHKQSPKSNYNGPRARLAVIRFTNSTGGGRWYSRQVGDAMAAKLTSELVRTRQFKVLNRRNMKDIQTEIGFGQSGAVTSGSAARFGKMSGAKLVVIAAITDFEDNTSGKRGRGAVGGGGRVKGGLTGILAGLKSGSKSAYMAVNIEVIDVETSETVVSEQVSATIKDTNWGAGLIGFFGVGGGAGVLSGWEKEPKGKALQEIIAKTVALLSENIPGSYYTEPSFNARPGSSGTSARPGSSGTSAKPGRSGASASANKPKANRVNVKMQNILMELGYFKGPADGVIGKGTKKAIRKFQIDYDLKQTGELNPATNKTLMKLVM